MANNNINNLDSIKEIYYSYLIELKIVDLRQLAFIVYYKEEDILPIEVVSLYKDILTDFNENISFVKFSKEMNNIKNFLISDFVTKMQESFDKLNEEGVKYIYKHKEIKNWDKDVKVLYDYVLFIQNNNFTVKKIKKYFYNTVETVKENKKIILTTLLKNGGKNV